MALKKIMVYVIDANYTTESLDKIADEDFIEQAKKENRVYPLSIFQREFNTSNLINNETDYIRFIWEDDV